MYQMYVHVKWMEVFVHSGKKVFLYVVEKQNNKSEIKYVLTE
jgi:hypothetical protein